jgi:hypothetical protein
MTSWRELHFHWSAVLCRLADSSHKDLWFRISDQICQRINIILYFHLPFPFRKISGSFLDDFIGYVANERPALLVMGKTYSSIRTLILLSLYIESRHHSDRIRRITALHEFPQSLLENSGTIRHSSVGIAIRLLAENPRNRGSISGRGKRIFCLSWGLWGSPSLLYNVHRWLFLWE